MTDKQKNRGVGRPKKATSYIQRSVKVVLPDMVMLNEWKEMAKGSNLSLSKFVIERVEDSLRQNGDGDRYSRKDLIERNMELEQMVQELQRDLSIKTKAFEALEHELQILRVKPFLGPVMDGERELGQQLIELFRSRKRVSYDELLPLLGVKPMDIELVKGINNQIEALTKYGLITQDLKGWRWVE